MRSPTENFIARLLQDCHLDFDLYYTLWILCLCVCLSEIVSRALLLLSLRGGSGAAGSRKGQGPPPHYPGFRTQRRPILPNLLLC